jgi:hypothetical protein
MVLNLYSSSLTRPFHGYMVKIKKSTMIIFLLGRIQRHARCITYVQNLLLTERGKKELLLLNE